MTEKHRHECEARHWIKAYDEKVKTEGKLKARAWWEKTISDIKRIRGDKATDELRLTMNEMRKDK